MEEVNEDYWANKAAQLAAELSEALPMSATPQYSKLFDAACDILNGDCTFEEAIARLTSKKPIKRG